MKNVNYIAMGILGIAVIILFILHFNTPAKSVETKNQESVIQLDNSVFTRPPVAYINTDTLLLNYEYAKDLNETLMRKAESTRATLNQKGSKLKADMTEFQRKYENNAFLSAERAQQEQASLLKRQEELQIAMERAQQEITAEQLKLNQALTDTITRALKEYNVDKKYQIIYNNVGGNSTILIADDVYNITSELIDFLNKKYTSKK